MIIELYLLKFCIDKAPIGILMLSPETRVLAVNDYTARSRGYTSGELQGMTIFDFYPEISPVLWYERFRKIRENGAITFETTHKNKDGIGYPMEITAAFMEFLGREVYL